MNSQLVKRSGQEKARLFSSERFFRVGQRRLYQYRRTRVPVSGRTLKKSDLGTMAPESELQRRSHVVAAVTGIESRQHRRTDSHLRLGRSVGDKVIFGPP